MALMQYYLGNSGGMFTTISVISTIISIGLAFWVYKDAQQRNIDETMWACIVCLCGCFGIIAYMITRSSHPVGEGGYQRRGAYNEPGQGFGPQPYGQGYQTRGGNVPNADQDSYSRPPPQAKPGPFHEEEKTQKPPKGLGVPPSEYGKTTLAPKKEKSGGGLKRCKFCDSEVPGEARFCPNCGGDEFEQ